MYGIPKNEQPTVFWVVPLAAEIRHAISAHPGALIHGERTPTQCGIKAKVPFATPLYRKPPTVLITDRCPQCVEALKDRPEVRQLTWDF